MNPIVIKLGGAAGVDAEAVCADVAALVAEGWPLVLVHGTSAAADALAARVRAAGAAHHVALRPREPLHRPGDAGALRRRGGRAGEQERWWPSCSGSAATRPGLSGVDGRLLVARRKDAVRAIEGGRQRIIRDDYTGQLESANGDLLRLMLGAGYTPVVAPLALGTQGERLNVDGDRAAAMLAGALNADALIILSNVPGLLANFPDESSLIRHVPADRPGLVEGLAQGRMKKKAAGRPRSAGQRACRRSSWPIRAGLTPSARRWWAKARSSGTRY